MTKTSSTTSCGGAGLDRRWRNPETESQYLHVHSNPAQTIHMTSTFYAYLSSCNFERCLCGCAGFVQGFENVLFNTYTTSILDAKSRGKKRRLQEGAGPKSSFVTAPIISNASYREKCFQLVVHE